MTIAAYIDSGSGAGLSSLGLYFALMFVTMFATMRIVTKAGYNWMWTFVVFVPVLNVVMFFVFALADWPALDDGEPA